METEQDRIQTLHRVYFVGSAYICGVVDKPLLKPTVKYFVCYVWLQVTYLQPFFLTIRENAVVPNAPCLNPIFPAFSEILCAVIPNSAHPLFAENP